MVSWRRVKGGGQVIFLNSNLTPSRYPLSHSAVFTVFPATPFRPVVSPGLAGLEGFGALGFHYASGRPPAGIAPFRRNP